jgi:hypothetical protein
MTDIEKARHIFQEAGLAFPTIPREFAAGLKEQGKWLFSTRELKMSPYNLQHYVHEGDGGLAEYVVLGHSGHGTNSYAIQYYLVSGPLRMFLHLGWGGVYMDADAAASKIRECFSLADQIVPAATTVGKLAAGERLTIVGSDFYGSYWSAPGQSRQKERGGSRGPAEVLTEVLHWLKSSAPNQPLQQTGEHDGFSRFNVLPARPAAERCRSPDRHETRRQAALPGTGQHGGDKQGERQRTGERG